MVEIISGQKGKGKTKELLDRVNESVNSSSGNIVYLDKSQKHMYELSNKVRLINVLEYPIDDCEQFLGFICGIISQDNDQLLQLIPMKISVLQSKNSKNLEQSIISGLS